MSKRFSSLFFILIFFISILGQAFGASLYSIEKLGDIGIKVESTKYGSNMRVMVEKGNEKYYYSLNDGIEELPAQLGSGKYTVKILQNTSGNKYKVLKKDNVSISNNSIDVYLSSSQPIYWKNKDKLIELADTLTKDLTTDRERVEAVYRYIVDNIKYDYNKINTISTDYVPDLNEVIISKKGICYDYSALFAGILRSEGIHAKLVKGYRSNLSAYHAWNEVFLDGSWVIVDTTYDAALSSVQSQSMIKSVDEYNKVREY
ncbi:transglutaminase-like domain-containing protein [Tissierella sp. Yu-01]|uniref:transglutaminase-like domain-containing protein n=1 Tax=Tissierella sp. Yu-01 TaxID=3035694 RepID=UPI00240E38F5|nr:transglutaminase-like domain-containing protein [Tissierella sp. Yu-01]WFA07692.1 transglutaminase-like domain-containing protein [Tissierella sp. Yu-01]